MTNYFDDDVFGKGYSNKINKYFKDDDIFGKKDYGLYNTKKKSLEEKISKNFYDYDLSNTQYNPTPRSSGGGINWGSSRPTIRGPNAYIPLTEEQIEKVMNAMNMIQNLSESQQKQLIEATQEIRYMIDGSIRSSFGATNHFNAIRCLNNPEITDVKQFIDKENIQLAGEEYFGLNRFFIPILDIADIQWWALYENGSWNLDTWNPQGEHLDTGVNGWGELVGSVIKVNGKVLNPQEIISFYRTMKLRNDIGFKTQEEFEKIKEGLNQLDLNKITGNIPKNYEQIFETAYELGLLNSDGKTLTYTGRSMITPTTALERKRRQEIEFNPEIKKIIDPTNFELK